MVSNSSNFLRKIDQIQRELEYIKRDLIHMEEKSAKKTSLFGSVSGEDITDEMIEKAKRELFQEAEDI
jgi:cupin superfamily acireductone dioxygenase involved in methionine salvage